ncbi:hypothetical protein PENSTE_c031G02937 [Penicillium steckii]|uniref:Methyltransferase domain-containing protein n=1 Tax=Penicillium steckii TaxID=303698 RepID=A0A1V6SMN6_9EURO|nr:hypothetical protein PENSTE_c031G02937 [Penicillium steckii]
MQTDRLRSEAFGKFWTEHTSDRMTNPAQAGRNIPEPVGSEALAPPLLGTASGVVLDIGPGTGTQLPFLTQPAIIAIYWAEPCRALHSALRQKAVSQGISDRYHILPSGIAVTDLLPALKATKTGVMDKYERDPSQGIFDTIICRSIQDLYDLLKPGGRLLVTEHVVNPWRSAKGSVIGRLAQAVYQILGWSWFMGDCRLDRNTERALQIAAEKDGGWEVFDLETSFEQSPLPYISGTLVKKML